MALGTLAARVVSSTSIKKLIQEKLTRSEDNLPLEEGGWVRASSLPSLCPREEVICSRKGVVRKKVVSSDLSLVFAHGTALHWALQNLILNQVGILVGEWICMGCGKVFGAKTDGVDWHSTLVLRPAKCDCGSEEFIYKELYLKDEVFRVHGHPDGFLRIGGLPGLGIFEAKSISPKGAWEIRNVPNLAHVLQAHTYMWLTGLSWAKILYWDKGGFGSSSLVEHHIERDEETIRAIKTTLNSIWEGVRGERVPDRICTKRECDRANNCAVAELCFGEFGGP